MNQTTNLPSPAGTTNATGLHDIKPPVDLPSGWEWLWWTLAVLALLALIAGVLLWLKRRRENRPAPPPIPPHVRALERLREALALIAQPEPFVVSVSSALRLYLEERFDFHAPERTTEEFLHELQAETILSARHKESLAHFLASSDLVKFARYQPGDAELRDLHSAAVSLVEETIPVADLSPAAAAAQPPAQA